MATPRLTWARWGVSLIGVFVLARVIILLLCVAPGLGSTRSDPTSACGAIAWPLLAMVYQDLWVAIGAITVVTALGLAIDRIAPSSPSARLCSPAVSIAYLACALYVALNVPIAALLGSPLTYPMLAGAGGALADSVLVFVTPANVAAAAAVGMGAVLIPRWVADPLLTHRRVTSGLACAGLAVALLGPFAARHVDPDPRARNALAALAGTAWRQWQGAAWAATDIGGAGPVMIPAEGEAADLTHFSGAAAGHNVVWIVLESTGARYLQPYGAVDDPMPNVSALARGGLVFDNAYSVYPESIKGLYSLICSVEPAAYTAADRYTAERLPCPDLPGVLRTAGYQTALFHSGRFVYLGMDAVVADRGYDVTADAGAIGGAFASSFGVDEASTVARILDYVDQRDPSRPFFIHYLPIAGHHPYESPGDGPRPFGEADDFRRYQSDLYAGDHAIGTLIAGLRDRGLGERTLWIISGDHGEAFYQHEGNFAHSLHLYEENVHVPLIMAGARLTARMAEAGAPGKDGGGNTASLRVPQVTSAIDVAPTLLDLLGIDIPVAYRGRSRLTGLPGLARFYTDHTVLQMGLRHGHWKYIEATDGGQGGLFDLAKDPDERRDVGDDHPGRVTLYSADLARWAAERRAAVGGGAPRAPGKPCP